MKIKKQYVFLFAAMLALLISPHMQAQAARGGQVMCFYVENEYNQRTYHCTAAAYSSVDELLIVDTDYYNAYSHRVGAGPRELSYGTMLERDHTADVRPYYATNSWQVGNYTGRCRGSYD